MAGCATPLGKFNKQEKVEENIQQEKANNAEGLLSTPQIKLSRKIQTHLLSLKWQNK